MIKKFKFRVFMMGTIMSDTKYTSVDNSLEFYDDAIFFFDSYGDRYEVELDDVAQFLGYDKNGKEIYSDDAIRVYDSNRYPLTGIGIEDTEDFFKISDIGKTFDNVELVEEK